MSSDQLGDAIRDQRARLLTADLERRLRAGEQVTAEDVLRDHSDLAEDDELAIELVYAEFVTLEDMGQIDSAESFLKRYPIWSDRLQRLLEVHFAFDHQDLGSGVTHQIKIDDTTSPERPVPTGHVGDPSLQRSLAQYEFLSEIARGGMGIVHRARQKSLNRIVAIKSIRSDATLPQRSRFRAEAEAAALLQHPNIVQIFEVGAQDDVQFISMEYVSGTTLEQSIRADTYSIHDAAQLILTLAEAMEYAHQHGVIHRDLKPGNILLREDGTPKISDFGLAKRLLSDDHIQTQSGAILGTPCYMSPEQAAGQNDKTGPHTDVYALGTILYELMTGRPPFLEETPIKTLERIRFSSPIKPRKIVAQIPSDLETICLKCLSKETTHRYGSCRELADELDRFLNHRPIRTRPIGIVGRGIRWSRRRPVVAALSASLLLLAAVFSVVFFGQRAREQSLSKAVESTAKIAEENQERAELASAAADANFQKVRELVESWTHLGGKLGRQPRMGQTAEQTLSRALQHYEEFLTEHDGDEEIRRDAASAYLNAGNLQLEHGHLGKSEQTLRRAVELYESLPDQDSTRFACAWSYRQLAHAYRNQSKWQESETTYRKAMEIFGRLLAHSPENDKYNIPYANTLVNLCGVLKAFGRDAEAEQLYSEAIGLQLAAIHRFADQVDSLGDSIARIPEQSAEASEKVDAARQLRELLVSKNHKSLSKLASNGYLAELALSIDDLGSLMLTRKRFEEAAHSLHEGLEIRQLIMPYVENNEWDCYLLARSYKNLGILASSANNCELAIENYVNAISWLDQLTEEFPSRMDFCRELGSCLFRVGSCQRKLGHNEDAMQNYERSVSVYENAATLAPTDPRLNYGFAKASNSLAWGLVVREDPENWEPIRAIQLAEKAVELVPTASAYINTLGAAYYRAERFERAEETLLRAIESSKGGTAWDWYFLAMTYAQLGDLQSAESWYEKAERWSRSQDPLDPEVARIQDEAKSLMQK